MSDAKKLTYVLVGGICEKALEVPINFLYLLECKC